MQQQLTDWRLRRGVVAAFVAVMAVTLAAPAGAVSWEKRWTLGVRTGLFLHADKQGGGFRVNGQVFGSQEPRTVNLQDGPIAGLTLGYGLKKFQGDKRWQSPDLTLELEVSRWSSDLKTETGFLDPNASTRIGLPANNYIARRDGDEVLRGFPVAEVTTTPVLVNALLHWGSSKADFYAGLGAGLVLVEATEKVEYTDFVGDAAGDDVTVDDVWAVNVKLGSNVALTKSGRWYLYFEGQFLSTQLLGSQQQVSWPGVDGYFGQQQVDTDDDNAPDTVLPADYRLVDPGKVRIDGALATIGLRYRFGGKGR